MTVLEVCNDLSQECKPYALIRMRRNVYWSYLRRIQLGKCKPATVTKFFNTFGYTGKWDSWEKAKP